MKKISNKGFVLAELLVVCVFLMVIFSMIYSNFLPLQGEYEIREGYDDVDSKYAVYWIKTMIEDSDYIPKTANIKPNKFIKFQCNDFSGTAKQQICSQLLTDLGADTSNIYITYYNLFTFKEYLKGNPSDITDQGLKDYVNFLPEFKNIPSLNNAQYRVIAKFNNEMDASNGMPSYSTIEVNRKWED